MVNSSLISRSGHRGTEGSSVLFLKAVNKPKRSLVSKEFKIDLAPSASALLPHHQICLLPRRVQTVRSSDSAPVNAYKHTLFPSFALMKLTCMIMSSH